jgi:urease accessory protein
MSELTIIQQAKHGGADGSRPHIHLPADRATLAKRRWRGIAEDGREFGFDLNEPLENGDHFFTEDDRDYVISQTAEDVLEIPLTSAEQAAHVAWNLGNLHFGVQVAPGAIRIADDPAVQQFLSREHIAHRKVSCVFTPHSAGAHHHHHHHG